MTPASRCHTLAKERAIRSAAFTQTLRRLATIERTLSQCLDALRLAATMPPILERSSSAPFVRSSSDDGTGINSTVPPAVPPPCAGPATSIAGEAGRTDKGLDAAVQVFQDRMNRIILDALTPDAALEETRALYPLTDPALGKDAPDA